MDPSVGSPLAPDGFRLVWFLVGFLLLCGAIYSYVRDTGFRDRDQMNDFRSLYLKGAEEVRLGHFASAEEFVDRLVVRGRIEEARMLQTRIRDVRAERQIDLRDGKRAAELDITDQPEHQSKDS